MVITLPNSCATCDGCQVPLASQSHIADCELPNRQAWGYLCMACVQRCSVRIGWGHGQLYQRLDGAQAHCEISAPTPMEHIRWQLIAGGPMTSEEI